MSGAAAMCCSTCGENRSGDRLREEATGAIRLMRVGSYEKSRAQDLEIFIYANEVSNSFPSKI